MARFNRGLNRRRPTTPPYQRDFQWDAPSLRDWNAEEQYWRGPPPNWERPYWRGPPLKREGRYWRGDSLEGYSNGRGRPYYRNCHLPPTREEAAALNFAPSDSNQSQPHDQRSLRTYRRNSATMSRKKGQTAYVTEVSRQDDPNESSQEVINLAEDSDVVLSNTLKRKRRKSNARNDQDKATAATLGKGTENQEAADHDDSDSENGIERTITAACTHLKLDRGPKLVIEASSSSSESECPVPTIGSQLTRRTARYRGSQNKPWDAPVKNPSPTTMVVLNPILDEAPDFDTMTLAQEFIRCPEKRWLRGDHPKLCVGIPYYEKYYIWARMMLLTEEDKIIMDRADILRGVFGSLFFVPKNWPLIQAFIASWNVSGHTIVTSQGEMGYSLLLVSDAMGIPISGHAYDEYIPSPFLPDVDDVVKVLHAIYAKLCKWRLSTGSTRAGLVSVRAWLDYFLDDKRRYENISETSLPHDYYAPALDPFLKNFGFQVASPESKNPSAFFSGYRVDYRADHSKLEYRAAFVATWLCIYCVPIDGGLYIRPEVFTAAASIARGTRKAIGIASLANLYSCLDAIFHSVTKGTTSASQCDLPVPAHYIMGWFAAYWKAISNPPFCSPTFVKNPPFIVDSGKASQVPIDLPGAHRIFTATDEQKQELLSLDFIGRQGSIHFGREGPIHLNDSRETPNEERSLKICEIDMIISSMVGGVSHRRCQFQNNQAYCPHRFARSHNCDQEVPDFFMDGKLQFSDYLKGTLRETKEFLTRRLLGYLRPGGHSFELLPKTRPTHCSYDYLKWCTSALSFLQQMDIFATTIDAPDAQKNKPATSSIPRLTYTSPKQISGAPTEHAKKTTESLSTPTEESPEAVPTKKAKKAAGSLVTLAKASPVVTDATKRDKKTKESPAVSTKVSHVASNSSKKGKNITGSPVVSTKALPVVASTTKKSNETRGRRAALAKETPVVVTRAKQGQKATESPPASTKEALVVAETKKGKKATEHPATSSKEALVVVALASAGTKMKEVTSQDTKEQASMPPADPPADLGVITQLDNAESTATGISELPAKEDTGINGVNDHDSEATTNLSSNENKQPTANLPGISKKELKKFLKGDWNANKRIDHLNKIKESTQMAVQQYVAETKNAFDSSTLPSAPKKFDQSPGASLHLPESADTKMRIGFGQIVGGLRALQALANAENFSQKSFLDALTSNLDLWENFFSSYFTDEVKVMVSKLQSLRKELSEEPDQQPHSIDVSERTKQLKQMLEKATALNAQLAESRAQVDKDILDGEKRQQHLDTFEVSIVSNIQELEAQLASEKESLKLVRSHKAEILTFYQVQETVSEAINAGSSNLKEAITKGEYLSKKMHEFQQAKDDNGGLPGPVQALRKLIKAYRIEE